MKKPDAIQDGKHEEDEPAKLNPDLLSRRLRGIRAAELLKLVGIVNIGGDAVKDCEALYDGDDDEED